MIVALEVAVSLCGLALTWGLFRTPRPVRALYEALSAPLAYVAQDDWAGFA